MKKQVISASDVARASGTLVVPADAVITPLAHDLAAERGIDIVRDGQPASHAGATAAPADDALADTVRAVVARLLGEGALTSSPSRPQVKHCVVGEARLEPFAFPGPPAGMAVATGDVVTSDDGAPMAAGYMTLTAGEFPWTFDYDEIQIVLEGELHLGGDAGHRVGRPGDIMFIPKGSRITFGTPSWTKFVYVTFPANWAG